MLVRYVPMVRVASNFWSGPAGKPIRVLALLMGFVHLAGVIGYGVKFSRTHDSDAGWMLLGLVASTFGLFGVAASGHWAEFRRRRNGT